MGITAECDCAERTAIDIERTSFVIAGRARARTVRPKCAQTILVARAHEQRRHNVAEIGTSTHLPVLDEPHEREAVGHELEVTLHELVDLSLIGKQLHWAVVGPLFRPLHLHLDELVDSWRELSDTVAERAVALGYVPDGQAQAVAAGSPLTPAMRGPVEDHAVVWELVQRITMVSELVRGRMDRLGRIDLASQDVLIDVVRTLEEQQWMLRVQLTGRS